MSEKITKDNINEKIASAKDGPELNRFRKEAVKFKAKEAFNNMIVTLGANIEKIGKETKKKAQAKKNPKIATKVDTKTEAAEAELQKSAAETQQEAEDFEKKHGKGTEEKDEDAEASSNEATATPEAKKGVGEKYEAPYSEENLAHMEALRDQPVDDPDATAPGGAGGAADPEDTTNKKGSKKTTSGGPKKKTKTTSGTQQNTSGGAQGAANNGGPQQNPTGAPAQVGNGNWVEAQNLEEAKTAYFEAYGNLEKQMGWQAKVERKIFGRTKAESLFFAPDTEEGKKLIDKNVDAEKVYQKFLGEKVNEMIRGGSTPAEIEIMIYTELQAKKDLIEPIVPERIRSIGRTAAEYYTKIPKPVRMATSTVLAMGFAAVAAKGVTIGVLGYGATRAARIIAGGAAGQLAVSAKNFFTSAEKSVKKIQEKGAQEVQGMVREKVGMFNEGMMDQKSFEALEAAVQKRMDAEQNARLKHLIADFVIRGVTMGATSAGLNAVGHNGWFGLGGSNAAEHGAGNHDVNHSHDNVKGGTPENQGFVSKWYHKLMGDGDDKHAAKTDAPDPIKNTPPAAPTPPPAPVDTHIYKPLAEVKYDSHGAIATWKHVQDNIKAAYTGADGKLIDASKIPSGYQHILDKTPLQLAKEFGGIDSTGKSLNMLEGSGITFDDHGNVVSHSLRNASGAAEDHNLITTDAKGNATYGAETNERYVDYKQAPAAAPAAPQNPNFGSGITTHDPQDPNFGKTNANGFMGNNGLNHNQFQSHIDHSHDTPAPTPPPADPNDPRDNWHDGKHHSKHWYKTHDAEGHTKRWYKHHQEHGSQSVADNAPGKPGPYDAEWDDEYYNDPTHHAPQPHDPTLQPLDNERVDRILNRHVRYIDKEYLAQHANDPARPLYETLRHMQRSVPMRNGESVAEYLGRAKIESQDAWAQVNVDRQNWLSRHGFFR